MGVRRDEILNVHERVVPGSLATSADLLAGIARPGSVWPADRWPPLDLDRGLTPGSRGGHGPIRYTVIENEDGERVRFALDPGSPVAGWHELSIRPAPRAGVLWRHVLCLERPSLLARTLVVPQHDALVEDLLDGAVARTSGADVERPELRPGLRARRTLTAGIGALRRFRSTRHRASMSA